ncbi:hypothetical protein Ddc_10214 [Ditylenchus destructor]|nr:hypothetical protein Ddc_10214 [Ditylenchus destructor]
MREEMQEREIIEIESIDSTHSQHSDEIDEISVSPAGVSSLEQLELLFKKLRIQFFFCFTGILLTILAYSIVRSNDQCCEFPFKESSCVAKSVLPPFRTNHSTLGKEIDEFIADSRAKVSTLHDAIQMHSLTDRQRTLDAMKGELWELAERHSANLAAFGAIKREDERMEELEVAITDGYAIFIFFSMFGSVYIFMLPWVNERSRSNLPQIDRVEEKSAEEDENSHNSRIKKLKRRIPIFYLATLICILVQLGLYVTFLAGQYYSGSCPIYATIESIRRDKLKWGKTYLPKSFTNYTTYSDELQSTLDLHLEELNKSMQSPTLEVRELGWNYEYKAIEAAFRHHTELKQYHVDRNSAMPRQISYAPQSAKCRFLMVIAITLDSIFIGSWVLKESAIW